MVLLLLIKTKTVKNMFGWETDSLFRIILINWCRDKKIKVDHGYWKFSKTRLLQYHTIKASSTSETGRPCRGYKMNLVKGALGLVIILLLFYG